MNAEFQRIARTDKKVFLSDQCNETEENNRMGKTRDLFKKIRYQGSISCKDGHNKGQKWYGPNRSRRYEEEVARIHRRTITKKIFMTQITTMVLQSRPRPVLSGGGLCKRGVDPRMSQGFSRELTASSKS